MLRWTWAFSCLVACGPEMASAPSAPSPNPPTPVISWNDRVDTVFPEDALVEVALDLPDDGWATLLAAWDEDQEKIYMPASATYGGVRLDSVGVRLKGFSSLNAGSGFGGTAMDSPPDARGKFPLKIDFNRFGGDRLEQLDKVGLSNNWSDMSLMRERLASRVYRGMGIPAAQTSYASVSIDGVEHGLYTLVQPIDERFIAQHFGEDDAHGNLYKAVFTSSSAGALTWSGSDPAAYVSTSCQAAFEQCGLLLKSNEDDPELNDYADLIELLDVVNNSPDGSFEADLEGVFDVQAFLRFAAVTNALSSFDTYLGMGHNYYLFHRPSDGRFVMLPWDLNESYAGHPCPDGNAISFPADRPVCNQRFHDFVLARRVFQVPAYREAYRSALLEVAQDWLTPERHQAWIAELDALIGDRIATDPNYIGSEVDHQRALGTDEPDGVNRGGHGGPEYNLMDFVTRRQSFLLGELEP